MKSAPVKKIIARALAAVLATATAGTAANEDEGFRTFTNTEGKEIEAKVLSKADTTVTLLVKGRKKSAVVPIDTLSEADREYLEKWGFLAKCRTLTVRELLELRGYESFKFRFSGNSILVPGRLNGVKARFLIDTGAHSTVLHEPFAREARCKVGPMDEVVSGVAGTAPAAWTEVDEIKLGETILRDRRLLSTDLLRDMPAGSKLPEEAIFGAEFLSQLDAVISYRERLIFLRPDLGDGGEVEDVDVLADDKESKLAFRLFKLKDKSTLRGRVAKKTGTGVTIELVGGKERSFTIDRFMPDDALFIRRWSEDAVEFEKNCRDLTVKDLLNLRGYESFETERIGNHIFVDGTLNGDEVKYMVDTGADGTVFNVGSAQVHKCQVGPMDQWVYGIGGRAPAAVTQFGALTVGRSLLENRRILSTDLARGREEPSIGIFGGDFMRELDAVITYREMRLFLRQR
ncbi:MAG: clan AA aspartic protease [Akkermansiaceae bacterium]|nr:clan AA aspartic protease [Akkermansiaceae bacterium]